MISGCCVGRLVARAQSHCSVKAIKPCPTARSFSQSVKTIVKLCTTSVLTRPHLKHLSSKSKRHTELIHQRTIIMEHSAQQPSVRRTAADEDDDRTEAIKNIQDEAYLDWPNEVGVSDFLVMHISTHDPDSILAV